MKQLTFKQKQNELQRLRSLIAKIEHRYNEILSSMIIHPKKIDVWKSLVNELFSIDVDEKTRKRKVLWPRQTLHYLAKRDTKENLMTIGATIGGVDHATVINSISEVQKRIDTKDKEFLEVFNKISNALI